MAASSTTFSYAQAAKGQSGASSTQTQSPLTNGHASEPKDNSPSELPSDVVATREETAPASSKEVDTTPNDMDKEVASPLNGTAPAAGARHDDDDMATEGFSRLSEPGAARSASVSTRVTDDNESKKTQRKGRKGKNGDAEKKSKDTEADAEKEKEKEQPKVELFEAPIPTVNIWAQRKEAQAAKTSVKGPVATQGGRAEAPSSTSDDTEHKKKSKAIEGPTASSAQPSLANGSKAHKKGDTDAENSTRRNAPRGSRVGGAPPPVADAAAWPTPEIATTREEKPKSAEKAEPQEDANASKSKRREWERIDFVPTVNWETHIPAPRGARGGRSGPGSRAGRDMPARGGSNGPAPSTVEKPTEGSNPSTKSTSTEQREPREKREGAAGRSNFAAQAAAKTAVADAPRGEQRKPGAASKAGKPKDGGAASEHVGPRGEGRTDRGRGGFRARGGGHGATNSQNFMVNGNGFNTTSTSQRGNHFMNSPMSQGGSFQGHGNTQGRGGRGGNRGQSGSYRGNGPNGPGRPRPLSSVNNFAPYQWDPNYAGMPMTAPPYAPAPVNYERRALLTQQLEFYFSIDNLLKDQYLRKHMDGQGFVPLSVVRNFHRVNKLCENDQALLRAACAEMTTTDFAVSSDGVERLRTRQNWPAFIFPPELRDPAARGSGPDSFVLMNLDVQQMNGMAGGGYAVGPMPYMNGNGAGEPAPYTNGLPVDGNGQLSATVPEFQPGNINGLTEETKGKENGKHPDAPNGTSNTSDAAKQLANGIHSEFWPADAQQS